jgi:hypothetical protein
VVSKASDGTDMGDNNGWDRVAEDLSGGGLAKPRRVLRTEPVCRYRDVLPLTVEVVSSLLVKEGHKALAEQMPGLTIFDRCSCEALDCASFYVQPRPEGRYGPEQWGLCFLSRPV